AEDGIRDRNVTGVQTCALPILNRATGRDIACAPRREGPECRMKERAGKSKRRLPLAAALRFRHPSPIPPERTAMTTPAVSSRGRSEERRVGKEGRPRWVSVKRR